MPKTIANLLASLLLCASTAIFFSGAFAQPSTPPASNSPDETTTTASSNSSNATQPPAQATNNTPINPDESAKNDATVALMEQIRFFIEDMAVSWPGKLNLNIATPDIKRQPECHEFEVFMSGQQGLKSRMNIGIRCTTPAKWVAYTQASATIDGAYYVTSRTINAGTVLSLDDLIPIQGDLLRVPAGSLTDPGQIVGYITTQRLAARRPIKASSLRSPASVERGQRVKIEVRGVGFVATSEGHALQAGEPGTQIQVRTASGQTVTATVLNGQTVLIPM